MRRLRVLRPLRDLVARDDALSMVVTFDFEPRFGPLGVVISKFFEYRAPPLVEAIFDRWEAEIDSREAGETSDDGGQNALYQ
jgi:hypothetical protein